MKSIFYGLLAAAALGSLVGCSKAYDSDPDTNSSGFNNPVAPTGTASQGQIVCRIKNLKQTYSNAKWSLEYGYPVISGQAIQAGNFLDGIALRLPYYFPGQTQTYTGDSAVGVYVRAVLPDTVFIRGGQTNDPRPPKRGYATIVLNSDANNNLVGTFNFKAYVVDTAGKLIDSVVATEGSFNVGYN